MAFAWSRRSLSSERSPARRQPLCGSSRSIRPKHRAAWLAALLLTLALGGVSDATIDLTGDWYITSPFFPPVVLVHFVQDGTCSPEPCYVSLQVSGAFTSTSGRVDPGTGQFNVNFDVPFPPPCGFIWYNGQVSTDGRTLTGGWLTYFTSCPSPTCLCRGQETYPLSGSRSPCGNGIVDPGEACDDGSVGRSGACCSLDCTHAVGSAGQDCIDDGDLCTSDICDATGSCIHPVAPAGQPCVDDGNRCTNDVCDASGNCTHPPQTCRSAQRSLLLVKNESDITKDTLIWKWTKGANTSQAEFADPTSTADYELCIFAGTTSALVDVVVIPASASKWSTLGTTGYKYKDPAATAGGIYKVVLKGSDQNKSKVRVRGRGAALAVPPLPATAPVTVQLVNGDNGICWGASFSDAQLLKNDTGQLKAAVP